MGRTNRMPHFSGTAARAGLGVLSTSPPGAQEDRQTRPFSLGQGPPEGQGVLPGALPAWSPQGLAQRPKQDCRLARRGQHGLGQWRADRAPTEDATARAEAQTGHPGGGGPSHSAKPTSAQSRQVGGRRTGRDGRTACFAVSWDVVMATWCQAGHRPREGDPEQAYTSQYLPGQQSSHPPGAAAGQC